MAKNINEEKKENKKRKRDCSWCFVTKILLTYCEKKRSSDREKLLKFKTEGKKFEIFLRSLEKCFQTVKGQNNFW